MIKTAISTALAAAVLLSTQVAVAAPAAPSGPHPRIWLDDTMQARFVEFASVPGSAVSNAIERCADVRDNPGEYDVGGWQGFEWVESLSSCLVAYKATGSSDDAATAIVYFTALLDDYQDVGDGLGGDDVVRHDTGYAIRTFAPYAALGYDWLYDAPGMTDALRARALGRFTAWSEYYRNGGYLNRSVGANYHAGWVYAATLMAIAGAGDHESDLWDYVVDEIFATDMAAAFAPGGVLEGGDWPEGWQYGPLSVLSYALSARALGDHGVEVPGMADWSRDLVVRHVYALTNDTRGTFAAGDTGHETVNLSASVRPLYAALLGPSSPTARGWAAAELSSLDLPADDSDLFAAMAEAMMVAPEPFPRDTAPTAFKADGTGNFYARSSFDHSAIWSVFQCSERRVPDHQHLDAGNFVLSRGADDLVVDPSPYGSLSTLTSNAPTVVSDTLSESYRPSQGPWGQGTDYAWAKQTASGVVAARCDYAGQYAKDSVASDIAEATRDVVVLPTGDAGTAIVIDHAVTGSATKYMSLRFRTQTSLSLSGDVARGDVGESSIIIQRVTSEGGAPNVRAMPTGGECWNMERGQCDYARVSGDEYRLQVPGPEPHAIHVIDAVAAGAEVAAPEYSTGDGYDLVTVERGGKIYAVVEAYDDSALSYLAPAGATHVIVGAPASEAGTSAISATPADGGCQVEVLPATSDDAFAGRPVMINVDGDCKVTAEADAAAVPGDDEDGSGNGDGDGKGDGTGDSGELGGGDLSGGCSAAGGAGGTGALLVLGGAMAFAVRRRRVRVRLG